MQDRYLEFHFSKDNRNLSKTSSAVEIPPFPAEIFFCPRPLFSKCSLLLLSIYFTGSGRQPGCCLLTWRLLPARRAMLGCLYCIPRDTPSHFWRDGIARSVVSASAMAWRYKKGPWENHSKAPPWREKRFKKREGEKSQTAAVVLREALRAGLIQEPWNSIEKSHWLQKKKKIRLNSLQPFRAQWISVSITHDMDVQRNQKIIHSVNSAAAISWLNRRKVNTNWQSQHISLTLINVKYEGSFIHDAYLWEIIWFLFSWNSCIPLCVLNT